MGYGGKRGCNHSHLILMVAEDKGMHSSALKKRCLLSEARANKDERETEELRSNLKLRAEAEGEFLRKLDSGRHHGRGG